MPPSKIMELVDRHEKYRGEGLPMIASESCPVPEARRALASDLAGRYHAPWYGGTGIAREMIHETEELAKAAFGAQYAIVLPLSGNVCDLAVLFALSAPGDAVGMVHFSEGGYPLGLEKFHRRSVNLPVDPQTYAMDPERVCALVDSETMVLAILGASFLLFPHPVKEIADHIHGLDREAHCVFDGSHVMGLIATGAFPNPLEQGADVLIGSTHKTLCGPQGGLILTNSKEHYDRLWQYLDIDLDSGIGLVDNPHVNRVAAVGVTLEHLRDNPDYGKRVIENSKAMARALDRLGVPLRFKARDFTETHQILMDIPAERAEELCHHLEEVRIFSDVEGRLGTNELTHRGLGTEDMAEIAAMVAKVYHEGPSEGVREKVLQMREKLDFQ